MPAWHDGYQQLCKTVETEAGATILAYDNAGNLIWSKAGATQTSTGSCNTADIPLAERTTRSYDGRNRLHALVFPDGRGNQNWTYTKNSLPATITTNSSSSGGNPVINSYDYNRRRLLANESFAVNGQLWNLGYGYATGGELASYVTPGATVDLSPNALVIT